MSIKHSVKCSKEEANKFLNDVKSWCIENNIPFTKMITLTAYEGEIRIYNGKKEERLSKKKVLQKDETGYFYSKTKIIKSEYTSVFRDEWYNIKFQNEEKEAIKQFFKI
jgi:hypothetical protein